MHHLKAVFALLLFIPLCDGLSDESLFNAFSNVFQLRDRIGDRNATVLQSAYLELEKMGVRPDLTTLADLPDDLVALVLMKAALAEYVLVIPTTGTWWWPTPRADSSCGSVRFPRRGSPSWSRCCWWP